LFVLLGTTRVLRAAELSWLGPEECANRAYVVEQVQALSRRSLEAAEGLVFAIRVERADAAWELFLTTRETVDGQTRERRFHGKTCTEVSDAAAVAIAMTLGENDDSTQSSELGQPGAEAEPPRQAEPAEYPVVVSPKGAPETRARSAGDSGIGGLVGAAAVVDVGALPSVALGPEISLGLEWTKLRLVVQGGYLLPNRAELGGGRGGTFDLLFGTLLGCFAQPFGKSTGFGCLGYEIGSMSGEGTGVDDPHLGSALWQAGRFELGASVPVSEALRLVLGLGASVPLDRPEFVLDAGEVVHRPAPVTVRARAGVELSL
jgi:hypothetical protein